MRETSMPRRRFDIATDAKSTAGALEQHGADLMILRRAPRRLDQAPRHVRIERIAPVRAVHGDGKQALVEFLEHHFVCGHEFLLSLLLSSDASTVIASQRVGRMPAR
jgi:hypothetical protein